MNPERILMMLAHDPALRPFPDHTQLPESDGTFVKNFQEHPQSLLLTDAITPVLNRIHPDGQYVIGQDCGIYWRETDPPERGAEAPDWFYVPQVPARLDGQVRRSYVLWHEYQPPLIALEFASTDGSEERDITPLERGSRQRPGKFWVYERIIRIPYYGIFVISTGELEMYSLVHFHYERMVPNERGHYSIPEMGVELGIWTGRFLTQDEAGWLRWWDSAGYLLPTGHEEAQQERSLKEEAQVRAVEAEAQAEQERIRAVEAEVQAEQERIRAVEAEVQAEQERIRADRLAEMLRALGVDLPSDRTGANELI